MSHRHRSRKAIFYFLLCLPLAFIAYLGITYYTGSINAKEVTAVEITLPGGNPVEYTDKETIDFFVGLINNATELSVPLREADESTSVTLKCIESSAERIYKIYPELSQTGCMFLSPGGKYYLIKAEDAVNLLSRNDMEYLYSGVFMPSMYVVTGQLEREVAPGSYEWHFKKLNGEYAEYTGKTTEEESQVYSIYSNRDNSIRFTRQPDDINVVITDTEGNLIGETYFNSLIFGRDTRLKVTVEASWNRKSDSKCDGTATYTFDVIYDIPAEVSFSSNQAEIGGYITVNVKYLNEGEEVVLTSPLNTGSLHFTENGGVKSAVLGIADDNTPGDYEIVYTIGDNNGKASLTVTGAPREERSEIYRLNITQADFEEKLGENAVNEFNEIIGTVFNSLGEQTYSKIEDFSLPSQNPVVGLGYGIKVIVNIENTTDTHVFYTIGNSYDVIENSKVTAAGDGRVVYAGYTEMLGNLLVIDHGLGVTSWYYGISSLERSVGTLVEKGSVLGFAGTNDYTDTSSLGFCISAGNTFINVPVD